MSAEITDKVQEKFKDVKKNIRYIFKPAVFANIQKLAKNDPKFNVFKNKPPETAFPLNLPITDTNKIKKQIQLSSEIQIPTGFSLTPEDSDHERYLVTAIVENIIKVMNYTKLLNDQYYSLIANVIMELIENAEKAILQTVAIDFNISNLKKSYYLNEQIRGKLVSYAKSKKKEAVVRYFYKKDYFSISITNNTFMDFSTKKTLEKKSNVTLADGASIADHCTEDADRIGAGIGLTMSRAILDGITKEGGLDYKFGPHKDNSGHAIMKIEFFT